MTQGNCDVFSLLVRLMRQNKGISYSKAYLELMALAERELLKLAKMREDISALEANVISSEAYLAGLKEAIRLLEPESKPQPQLRPGTTIFQVREVLEVAKRPLHISNIMKEISLTVDSDYKSVAGTIRNYVRRGAIFTMPRPNTFGLINYTVEDDINESIPFDLFEAEH